MNDFLPFKEQCCHRHGPSHGQSTASVRPVDGYQAYNSHAQKNQNTSAKPRRRPDKDSP